MAVAELGFHLSLEKSPDLSPSVLVCCSSSTDSSQVTISRAAFLSHMSEATRSIRSPRNNGAEVSSAHVRRELQIGRANAFVEFVGRAFPDDAGVLQDVDTVGMGQRKGDVLLAQQHGDGPQLPQPLQGVGDL